ncbi:serine/threonine-protein kinase [Embleya hyalina]|uniref:serine/threonine-protein kinase n=1 Tax=Embleya hyalina TaxID=516124 RepID=UPI000F840A82|nr:serine/threonine-protein kinase [Embleya hyalina]
MPLVVIDEFVGAGRYRLLARIGAGGMGVVWQAWDELLQRRVAIKCARVNDPRSMGRLKEEAAIAARFDSPHVVRVHDLVVEGDTWWLVMEYVDSHSLGQLIARSEQRPTPAQVASVGWQIAEALRVVHAHRVVHGDVTPENILVTADGTGKLVDFGISRALGADGTRTRDGSVWGKPRYLAPEVARGRGAGRASDVFSLGASLYAALEGHTPYGDSDDPHVLLRRARSGNVDRPTASGEPARLIAELLHTRPGHRPEPAEVSRRLRALSSPDRAVVPWTLPGRGVEEPIGSEAATRCGPAFAFPAEFEAARASAATRPDRRPTTTGTGTPTRVADTAPDTASDSRPPRRLVLPRPDLRRPGRLWPIGVAATIVATAGIMAWSPVLDGRTAPTAADSRAILVGDERTADPCALLEPASLARFGKSTLDATLGGFRRCDLLVHDTEGRRTADAELSFTEGGQELGPQSRARRIGDITVIEGTPVGKECPRILRLPDGYVVKVTLKNLGADPIDVCAMADAVTDHAIDVLSRGRIPRRSSPARDASLIRLDACSLLDASALARVPAIDAQHPNPGFGDWKCRWHSTVDKAAIIVRFYQREPLPPDIGAPRQSAGRQAFLTPSELDHDECTIRVVHRTYPNGPAHPIVELVLIEVWAAQSQDRLCAIADELGTAVAAKLPHP